MTDSKYKIQVKETNKDELWQPVSSKIDLLPNLPTGIIICGRSGSGKTQCLVNMLTNDNLLGNSFDYIYLYTGVKPDKLLIDQLDLPDENIHSDFTPEDIEEIMDKMEESVEKKGFKRTPSLCLLFDDILGNKEFLKSKQLAKLASANRHCNITYLICTQYYKALPPVLRSNASYFVIFPSSASELEKIASELCPPNYSMKEFLKIAKHATKNRYEFLSINTKADPSKQLRKNFDIILNL